MKESLFLIGIMFIGQGILLFLGVDIYGAKSGTIKATMLNGFIFAFIGVVFLVISKLLKKKVEYWICPKCEESFHYHDLKDGICPYCNVKTENLEGFYNKDK